jgi:hypothetical protein
LSAIAAVLTLSKPGFAPPPRALLAIDCTAMSLEPCIAPPWPALLPSMRKRGPLCEAVGRMRTLSMGHACTVPLGHGQGIGPLALFHFFQFSEYIQIIAKFKNLSRILFNS